MWDILANLECPIAVAVAALGLWVNKASSAKQNKTQFIEDKSEEKWLDHLFYNYQEVNNFLLKIAKENIIIY